MYGKRWHLVWAMLLMISTSLWAGWQNLTPDRADLNLIVANSTGERICVSTENAGLWVTQNGGESWTAVDLRLDVSDCTGEYPLAMVDAAGDTIIAGAHVSVDGGVTWQDLPEPAGSARGIVVSSVQRNLWFAYGGHGADLCRSTDHGQTWAVMDTAFAPMTMFADQSDANILYYQSADQMRGGCCPPAYVSHNQGSTWEVFRDPWDWPDHVGDFTAMARLSDGSVMAAGAGPGVVVSTDNGATWQERTILDNHCCSWTRRIVEDIYRPGTIYLTGRWNGGLWRTTDYGWSWQPAGNGLPDEVQLGTAVYQNLYSGDLYCLLPHGGIYRSRNHGASWQSLPRTPVGPQGSLLATHDGMLFDEEHSGDAWQLDAASNAWTRLAPPPSTTDTTRAGIQPVYKQGNSLIAVCGAYAAVDSGLCWEQMIYSSNNGQSWTPGALVPFSKTGHTRPSCYVGEATVRIVTEAFDSSRQRVIECSEDLGHTWTAYPWPMYWDNPGGPYQGDHAIYLFYPLWPGWNVLRSTNCGASWDSIGPGSAGLSDSSFALFPWRDELFALNGQTLWHYNGSAWQVRGITPTLFAQIVVVPGAQPVLVGMVSGTAQCWTSEDLGQTWTARNWSFPYAPIDFHPQGLVCDAAHNRLWLSTDMGPWYLDFSELSAPQHSLSPYPLALSLSAFPNPFNSTTRIRFDLSKQERVKLDIFDLQGRHVQTLVDELRAAGTHEIAFNGEGLASGTYFVRLNTSEVGKTEKILLLK